VLALGKALKDDDESVRYRVARALGHIGPDAKAAIPALIEALKEPDARVRVAAAEALMEIDPEAAKKAGVR
jgi:HEAT repeat protein